MCGLISPYTYEGGDLSLAQPWTALRLCAAHLVSEKQRRVFHVWVVGDLLKV